MGIKDKLISAGAEQFLKSYISDFGELKDFSINTSDKTIKLKVDLLGEKETFILEILKYDIINEGSKTFLKINQMNSSRAWMNVAFKKYLAGQKIEIPEKYSTWIKFID